MSKTQASIPRGTRDFSAAVVRKRNYLFNTIRTVFELYGFQPLETPAMENLDTLMGKYGEEGDKLIFKILNNGLGEADTPEKVLNKVSTALDGFKKALEGKSSKDLTERALRYDLTIPFARYVAMNHGQLTFPFKRYQIQPVWRADNPQRGRYREFYQCDADIVGSKSLINEAELTNIYAQVFNKLGLPVEIRINSRKILAALAELCGGSDKMIDITVAIDKLDKIGLEKVKAELAERGLKEAQVTIIERYLSITGSNTEKIAQLKELAGDNTTAALGIAEVEFVLNFQPADASASEVCVDFTLARGLNYYTGIIFEVKGKGTEFKSSIGGGGRYDDLTGLFGVPNLPGVGISFGVDRMYDVMEELNLFPEEVQEGTQVLFFNLGAAECAKAFSLAQDLRARGVSCELYHEQVKFDKQFKYAEKKGVGYVVIIGSKELEEGNCTLKNLKTGEQKTIAQSELVAQSF